MTRKPNPSLSLTTLEDRAVPTANLQFVNSSPYVGAATIDIYVNNAKTLNDLAFRQSTAFLSVPDGVALKIDFVAGGAGDNTSPLATQTLTLAKNSSAIAVAVGDPSDASSANKFGLAVTTSARTVSANAANAEVLVFHASPGAGPVDVKVRLGGTVINDLAYRSFAPGYLSLAPGKYVLDLTAADGVTRVGSYNVDLSAAAGTARTLVASGFAAPPAAGDPGFALVGIDAGGFGTLFTKARAFAETSYAVGAADTASITNGDRGFSTSGLFPKTEPVSGGAAKVSVVRARVATGDVTGDGVPDLAVGSGPGAAIPLQTVTVYDGVTRAAVRTINPFESGFTGGVFVAVADLNGDGFADIVITPDQGGGPRVQIRSGKDGTPLIADFFGIDDANFRGGARAGFADLNGDGTPDLVVSAGFGGGPRVAVFNGLTLLPGGSPGRLLPDFFVFENTLRNGAYVTGGDVDGDGYADLIAGGGPGGAPRVLALSGKDLVLPASKQTTLANFFAGDVNNRDGVRVVAKDIDGDYRVDIVAGFGTGATKQVRVFAGKALPTTGSAAALGEFNIVPEFPVQAGDIFVG